MSHSLLEWTRLVLCFDLAFVQMQSSSGKRQYGKCNSKLKHWICLVWVSQVSQSTAKGLKMNATSSNVQIVPTTRAEVDAVNRKLVLLPVILGPVQCSLGLMCPFYVICKSQTPLVIAVSIVTGYSKPLCPRVPSSWSSQHR